MRMGQNKFAMAWFTSLVLFSSLAFGAVQTIIPADIVEGQHTSKNYITNSHFEKNVRGVVAYADAAGIYPVDGVGGSPNVTCTRTTPGFDGSEGALLITKDAANRQGQGCSIAFTTQKKGEVLSIQNIYSIASGSYTDDAIRYYVYDVTNAKLIEPSAHKLKNHLITTGGSIEPMEFQTSIDSDSYRLIIHIAGTDTNAYSIKLDEIKIGKVNAPRGPPIGEWKDYTPTITLAGGGSITNYVAAAKWRQVGANIEVVGNILFNGAAGTWNVPETTLPPGLILDVTKLSLDTSKAAGQDAGQLQFSTCVAYNDGISNADCGGVIYHGYNYKLRIGTTLSSTSPTTLDGAGDRFNWSFSVPIVGFGSNNVLNTDFDARNVSARLLTANVTTTANVNTKITFATVENDTHSGFSSSTYTVKNSGYYDISGYIVYNSASWTATQREILYYRINSTDYEIGRKTITATASQVVEVSGAANGVWLSAGQTVELRALGEVAVTAVDGHFSITRSPGPAQSAAVDTVALNAYKSAAQNINDTTVTTISFDTRTFDTHNMLNTSTGVVTVPFSGKYHVDATVFIAQNTSGRRQFSLKKNGSDYMIFDNQPGASANVSAQQVHGMTSLSLLAGETIEVYVFQNSGGTLSLVNGQSTTALNVRRIGNY